MEDSEKIAILAKAIQGEMFAIVDGVMKKTDNSKDAYISAALTFLIFRIAKLEVEKEKKNS